MNRLKDNLERRSTAAKKTWGNLHDKKVSVSYQDTPLADVFADLHGRVKGLRLFLDPQTPVSEGLKVTYQAHEQKLGVALDKMFEGLNLGYVVISDEKSDHDGWLKV